MFDPALVITHTIDQVQAFHSIETTPWRMYLKIFCLGKFVSVTGQDVPRLKALAFGGF